MAITTRHPHPHPPPRPVSPGGQRPYRKRQRRAGKVALGAAAQIQLGDLQRLQGCQGQPGRVCLAQVEHAERRVRRVRRRVRGLRRRRRARPGRVIFPRACAALLALGQHPESLADTVVRRPVARASATGRTRSMTAAAAALCPSGGRAEVPGGVPGRAWHPPRPRKKALQTGRTRSLWARSGLQRAEAEDNKVVDGKDPVWG